MPTNRTTLLCQQCGTPFTVRPFRLLDPQRGKFCSPSCFWQHRRDSLPSLTDRFWPKVNKTNTCWIWTGMTANGYGVVSNGRTQKRRPAHRVAWELTYGPIPDGFFVCHRCDNPPCVNPAHLFLGTQAENMADMAKKHRGHVQVHNDPSQCARKLTASDVLTIRALYVEGHTQQAIADRFHVSKTTVNAVVCRRTWSHLP